ERLRRPFLPRFAPPAPRCSSAARESVWELFQVTACLRRALACRPLRSLPSPVSTPLSPALAAPVVHRTASRHEARAWEQLSQPASLSLWAWASVLLSPGKASRPASSSSLSVSPSALLSLSASASASAWRATVREYVVPAPSKAAER